MSPDPTPAFHQNDYDDFETHIASLLSGRSEPDRSELERFLRANPGMTVGDWKGKGPIIPADAEGWEKPWHRLPLVQVREEAVRHFARELPCNFRQAAARHPGLIWNPLARKYRVRQPSDPRPPEKVYGGRVEDRRRSREEMQTPKTSLARARDPARARQIGFHP